MPFGGRKSIDHLKSNMCDVSWRSSVTACDVCQGLGHRWYYLPNESEQMLSVPWDNVVCEGCSMAKDIYCLGFLIA